MRTYERCAEHSQMTDAGGVVFLLFLQQNGYDSTLEPADKYVLLSFQRRNMLVFPHRRGCCRLLYTCNEMVPALYLGPIPPPCIMVAFISWNRSPNRAWPFMYLSTHRKTQPSSREIRDLVVKSLTQSSKHR